MFDFGLDNRVELATYRELPSYWWDLPKYRKVQYLKSIEVVCGFPVTLTWIRDGSRTDFSWRVVLMIQYPFDMREDEIPF